jgi:Zn-dependent protease
VFSFALVNLLLGVFNLLPIPPLDGSALLERVLPARWLPSWYKFRPYGLLVIFVLVFMTGALSRLLNPLQDRLFDFVFQ